MVDFNKLIKSSDKFRLSALQFIATGRYCTYPQGSSEYFKFWDLEKDRCINGYTADDGDYITGYNYFYLNYCPIQRMVYTKDEKTGKVKKSREVSFPDFWDYDYYFFQALDDAEELGKHMCVLKSRRKGFSYKMASACCRNYYLIPASKSYVYASNKQYLTEDGILTKAWDYMDFIDDNTAWGKKRSVNTLMRKRAGFFSRDEYGNEVELGYKSEIIGVTLKDNASAGHPYDTTVYTPEGKTTWENIKVGSKLFDSKGGITTVKQVYELGEVDVYKFTLSDGRQIESTWDHNWRLYRFRHKQKSWDGKYEYKEIRDMSITTKEAFAISQNKAYKNNRFRIMVRPSAKFNHHSVPIDAYTVGLLLGDGCIKKSGLNRVPITQLPADMDEIKKFIPYNVRKQNSKSGIDYTIDVPNAKKLFTELGLIDKTAADKFVPDCYKYNDEGVRLGVINGLLDTDGSVTKDCGVIEYSTKSPLLADDMCWLLRSVGINCSKHSKQINGVTYYRVYVYCKSDETRIFNLPRKKERIKIKKNNAYALSKVLYSFVEKIEYVGKKISKCVSVDADDEVYLIDDFIETKNCRGKAGKLIIFEESGSFDNLSAAWQIARPSVELDGVAFGVLIAMGTGGDESSHFATLKDMFYHPEGYNCIGFPNIWDETATTNLCGFFVPLYTNLDFRDSDGNRIYMDNDGNTLRKKALDYILEERRKIVENATSNEAIDRWVAEHCITPSDACLEFNGNIFPKKELLELLALLRTNTKLLNHKQVGDLVWLPDGSLKWVIKKTGDITHYPLRQGEDPTGSIVIWEHPNREASLGLYIAGCLTPGEKVLTDKGYKAVEDVTFDDKLVSKEGNYVDIHNLQRYYKEDETIYKVRVSHSYSTTTFTSEHPLYVADQNIKGNKGGDSYGRISAAKMDFSFKPMKEVKEGQWIKYPNVYRKTSNFDIDLLWDSQNYRIDHRIDSPLKNKEFWWFVGLWLGGGYNVGDYNVSICFNSNELEYIDRFCKLLSLFKRSFSLRAIPEKHTVQASMCFKQLNRFLFKHFGKYADGKRIPEWVKFMDPEFKKALLQGYLDSDGCVYRTGKYCITGFVSINLPLLEAFLDILFSLGIISNMSRLRDSKIHHFGSRECATKPCYQLRMAQHDSIKFKSFYTGYDHKLEKIKYVEIRKHPKDGCFFSDDLSYIYFKIREIEKSKYTGVVYNFECDTHTFLCRNITTHNCDSYDYDESTTTSLGSFFIYKRIQSIELYSDIIVAEYTGRPKTADEFYENVRKLLVYYNARCMYENQNKGIYAYFSNKHCDYLLADQPDIISDIIKDSKVQRKKGCHMNKQLKLWSWGLIKDWLNEVNADGKKNLYNIMSEPLLEELIAANDIVNVDRVSALALLMIYREELYNVKVKEIKKENRERVLFDGPIFTQEWFRDDGTDNIEAYMF